MVLVPGFIRKYSYLAKLWQKMAFMPIFGHTFFSHNFWASWAEIFIGAQETIIYRLVMRNGAYLKFDFLVHFWQ